ncbi:MAG TPA: monofunctional biosynthetic peptidoglycan transglycosylase, partial [Pseudomonas sp.]|nr:monofunctional biosynthetic peptidoglycan transglycosylase [Pseudomonas sp.]
MFKLILRKTAKWLLIVALLSLLPVLVLRWAPAPGSMLMVERWISQRDDADYRRQYQWR